MVLLLFLKADVIHKKLNTMIKDVSLLAFHLYSIGASLILLRFIVVSLVIKSIFRPHHMHSIDAAY